jgi:O-antigen ligase
MVKSNILINKKEKKNRLNQAAFLVTLVFIFTIPWQNFILIDGIGTLARGFGFLTMGVSFIAILQEGRIRSVGVGFAFMCLFVLNVALSFYWSLSSPETLTRILTYIQLLAMVFILVQWIDSEERYLWILQAYVFGAGVLGTDVVRAYLAFGDVESAVRFTAQNFNANEVAAFLVIGIPIAWYLTTSLTHNRILLWLNWAAVPFFSICTLLTASRGGVLALIVALTVLIWGFVRGNILLKLSMIFGVYFFLSNIEAIVPQNTWWRLSELTRLEESNWGARRYIWQYGFEIFLQNPIFGVGAGAYQYALKEVFTGLNAHNVFMSVLVELGIIGVSLFLAIIGRLMLAIYQLKFSNERIFLFVWLLTWVAMSMSGNFEYQKFTWFVFGMILVRSLNFSNHILTPDEDKL